MIPVELDRLERVRKWAAVPTAKRNDDWVHEFESAFWCAPLCGSKHESTVEISGYTFLKISTRAWTEDYEFVRPAQVVDRLIDEGLGMILSDTEDANVVWMSLGEVVSYRLYGRAFSSPLGPIDFNLAPGAQVGLSQLSEAAFPRWARTNVRRYIQRKLGISEPKGCLVRFPSGSGAIVLDINADIMGDDQRAGRIIQDIRWRLPKRIPVYRIDGLAGHPVMEPF